MNKWIACLFRCVMCESLVGLPTGDPLALGVCPRQRHIYLEIGLWEGQRGFPGVVKYTGGYPSPSAKTWDVYSACPSAGVPGAGGRLRLYDTDVQRSGSALHLNWAGGERAERIAPPGGMRYHKKPIPPSIV